MRYSVFFVLLLIECSFLTIAAEKKVIFMIPRHVRRSPVASWHMRPPPLRKSHYTVEDNYPHLYNRPNGIIYGKPAFRYSGNHLPHGGDDFDQGHEEVNNVLIPYGKGISHAISFGRGYIPYDKFKGNFSPLKEDHRFSQNYHQKDQSGENTFSPIDPSHISLTTESDADFFLPDQNGSYESESESNGKLDEESKLFNSRSITKNSFGDKILLDNVNSASVGDEKSLNPTELSTASIISQSETTTAPIFVPSPKIGGSTKGVVIRDSVSLDDYNKKVEEFTKTWPGVVNIPGIHGGNIQHVAQTTGIQQLPLSAFAASSFPAASPWTSSLTGNQGYAVREDIVEPEYDFRTMSIQNNQVHSFPSPGNAVLPNIQNSYG